jgi:hypothetical protein
MTFSFPLKIKKKTKEQYNTGSGNNVKILKTAQNAKKAENQLR